MIKWKLTEHDFVLNKPLQDRGVFDTLEEAAPKAREIARGWCEGEEPRRDIVSIISPISKRPVKGYSGVSFRGDADFGALIVPVIANP